MPATGVPQLSLLRPADAAQGSRSSPRPSPWLSPADAAQGSRTSPSPVENVVWAEKPPSGTYRVVVHYYDYNERRTPVPFTVRITVAGEKREVRGTATGAGLQTVTEFTVP